MYNRAVALLQYVYKFDPVTKNAKIKESTGGVLVGFLFGGLEAARLGSLIVVCGRGVHQGILEPQPQPGAPSPGDDWQAPRGARRQSQVARGICSAGPRCPCVERRVARAHRRAAT